MDRNFMIKEGRYAIVKELGNGSQGTVWKTVDKLTGKARAIKRIRTRFSKYKDCLNIAEVKCLLKLGSHPNIVCLHDVILEGTRLYLVFDLMDCDLFKLMTRRRERPFSEHEVRNFCFQILEGLLHIHNQGYCHRDLKPENVLVRGDRVKIADFGLATNMLHRLNKRLEPYVVTRPYRAPELILGSTRYDFSIDIWAMGVIMVELFTGCPLFTGSDALHQMHSICSVIGSPDSRTWPQGLDLAGSMHWSFPEEFKNVDSIQQLSSLLPITASAEAIDLINGFLSWDPKRRPGAREALQHAFFYPCYNRSKDLAYNGEQTSEHVSVEANMPSSTFPGMAPKLFRPTQKARTPGEPCAEVSHPKFEWVILISGIVLSIVLSAGTIIKAKFPRF